MATGWNASDVNGGVVVSGTGNVVATFPSYSAIRSNTSHASGKYYLEVTLTGAQDDSGPQFGFGSSNSGQYVLGNQPGYPAPSDSIGIRMGSVSQPVAYNNVWMNSGFVASPMAAGETLSVCVDVDNQLYWFLSPEMIASFGANGWNGLSTAAPASGIGGISATISTAVYLVGFSDINAAVLTLNTGRTAYLRTPPSGFGNWDVWGAAQTGQAFLSGAGALTAKTVGRVPASGAFAGSGSLSAQTTQILRARGSFAGTSTFFWAGGVTANLVSATSSQDSMVAGLQGTQAGLAATLTSSDSATGFVTVPSISANTQQLQNVLVDAFLRGQSLQAPSTWYVALVTQLGSTTTPGLEVTGGSYARSSIAATLPNFAGTQGSGTTVASFGSSGTTSNNVAITFPAPTGNWGTIIGYELWDAPTGGNRWIAGKLTNPLTINNNDPARAFAIGALTMSIA